MCNLRTKGVQYACGHYIATTTTHKDDCRNKFCIHSQMHLADCPHCPQCNRFFGPDSSETIEQHSADFCSTCQYWWKTDKNHPHRQKSQHHHPPSSHPIHSASPH